MLAISTNVLWQNETENGVICLYTMYFKSYFNFTVFIYHKVFNYGSVHLYQFLMPRQKENGVTYLCGMNSSEAI